MIVILNVKINKTENFPLKFINKSSQTLKPLGKEFHSLAARSIVYFRINQRTQLVLW